MERPGKRRGPKRAEVVLSEEERGALEAWARRPSTANALALRARIVLACAAGGSDVEVAARLGMSRNTVGRWRKRYLASGLDGLLDEPRPGRPRLISDAQIEEVIVRTLETTPKDATHWSTRSMAAQVGLSQTAVSRIWRAFALQPHRVESWKLSRDPLFIDKVRDVVGLYLAPPERAVVLCVDEKSQIQALDRTAPILPLLPGHASASDARLQAVGHLQPVRRARSDQRQSDQRAARSSSGGRVQAVLAADRP